MALLKVAPEELQQGGQSLIATAGELEQLIQKLDRQVQTVNNGWEGAAQGGYVELYERLRQSLSQVPVVVDDLGKRTVEAANTFQQIDMELGQKLRL